MKRVISSNGVVYYCSPLIPCVHGFSTRLGGVSGLPHTASLNLGFNRGDSEETVYQNLSLFFEALGVDPCSCISVSQIHSSDVRYVTKDNAGEGFYKPERWKCDGYVADSMGITLGVRTADCVPVLLYAPPYGDSCYGMIAALHAGWRGTAAGIVSVGVEKMVELGAKRESIIAAIGPSIGACCYEVREDFCIEFEKIAGKALCDKYIRPIKDIKEKKGYWKADLKAVNYELLMQSGVTKDRIDVSTECTFCHPEEFYSHRYSGGIRGSMLSVITLSKKT